MNKETPLSEFKIKLSDGTFYSEEKVKEAVEKLKEAMKKIHNQRNKGHTRSNYYFNLIKEIDKIFGEFE